MMSVDSVLSPFKAPIPFPFLFFLTLLLMLISCSGENREQQAREQRFGVGVRTLNLVDLSRETPDCPWYPGDDRRTEIWYPTSFDNSLGLAEVRDASFDRDHAPYPLILWSHGFVNTRRSFLYLIPELVHRGFVVAGADFPSTSRSSPCKLWAGDGSQQALDIRFLIDTYMSKSMDPLDPYHGLIDPERIGALGHSFGGFTALLAGYSRDLGDSRIRAVFASSPFSCIFDEDLFSARHLPVMLIGGNRDGIMPFPNNTGRVYEMALSPKYLVQLDGGTHFGFRDLPETDDVNLGKILSLLGFDSSDLGGIRPEDFEWGLLRHFTEDLFQMFDDVGGSLDTCDFTVPGEWRIPPESVERQHEVLVRHAVAFFRQILKGIPDRKGNLDGTWASSQPDVCFTKED